MRVMAWGGYKLRCRLAPEPSPIISWSLMVRGVGGVFHISTTITLNMELELIGWFKGLFSMILVN